MTSSLETNSASGLESVFSQVLNLISRLMPSILENRKFVEWKPDGSPVTRADLIIEKELRFLLENSFDSLFLIGEESFDGKDASPGDVVAVLDPIDGTENFYSGFPIWGISLSIWTDGRHLGSLLTLPELGESLISGQRVEYFDSRILGFSSSISGTMGERLSHVHEARIFGCAVFNLISVIRGRLKQFENPIGAKSWDILAGLQLALEHGCEVIVDDEQYHGQYLEPTSRYRFQIRNQQRDHHGQGFFG
jgi:myo-inositol-1(or 4)-monophosphatase